MFLVLFFDKISAAFSNWKLKKSGQPYALEYEEHGHGGHSHEHHESLVPDHRDHRKSAAWSTYGDEVPLTASSTAYEPQSYALSPMMSPPIQSPPASGVTPHGPLSSGGYMPVSHGQHYGA